MARTGLQKGIKKADTSQYPFLIFFIGRNDWTRTSDLFVPNEAFYQAELHSVLTPHINTSKKKLDKHFFYYFAKI